jgi:cytochrome c-type biogenesis protein CcsB
MDILFFKITLALYFAGTFVFLAHLGNRNPRLSRLSIWITATGFGFHTIALAAHVNVTREIPLTNFYEALSFFSWALVLVFLFVEYRYRVLVLGSFILPLAFLTLISAAALPSQIRSLNRVFQNVWVLIHVSLTMLGLVAFTLAFVVGVMYLIQEHLLKSKRFNPLHDELPSLDFLDGLNQKSVILGFPLLTLGMITGAMLSRNIWEAYFSFQPVETLTLVTWLFYFAMLQGRLTVGWRAKKAAYLAVVGFVAVVLTVGVNFFAKGPHNFFGSL